MRFTFAKDDGLCCCDVVHPHHLQSVLGLFHNMLLSHCTYIDANYIKSAFSSTFWVYIEHKSIFATIYAQVQGINRFVRFFSTLLGILICCTIVSNTTVFSYICSGVFPYLCNSSTTLILAFNLQVFHFQACSSFSYSNAYFTLSKQDFKATGSTIACLFYRLLFMWFFSSWLFIVALQIVSDDSKPSRLICGYAGIFSCFTTHLYFAVFLNKMPRPMLKTPMNESSERKMFSCAMKAPF